MISAPDGGAAQWVLHCDRAAIHELTAPAPTPPRPQKIAASSRTGRQPQTPDVSADGPRWAGTPSQSSFGDCDGFSGRPRRSDARQSRAVMDGLLRQALRSRAKQVWARSRAACSSRPRRGTAATRPVPRARPLIAVGRLLLDASGDSATSPSRVAASAAERAPSIRANSSSSCEQAPWRNGRGRGGQRPDDCRGSWGVGIFQTESTF
jgi:hypothetical protein